MKGWPILSLMLITTVCIAFGITLSLALDITAWQDNIGDNLGELNQALVDRYHLQAAEAHISGFAIAIMLQLSLVAWWINWRLKA